ncbi:MAG TPA: VCBS repeat-containing protein [Arenimonas sp.]|uniref:FG-GAP repeat domain-containing protein n=1 Tax=Arenimonas sp. TaxID=1872635 RepID=UPI002D7FDC04|nr:VCBS repeat-containing protein [Arenimonas sp.]HEU0152219.1 VCBS repeat-containing protein [Arenimonas sp.]
MSSKLGPASGVATLLLLTGCLCAPSRPVPAAQAPAFNFDRFVYLEEVAENTANASLGDLDGDGDPDIVLAKGRHWPQRDLVLLNDGQGDFGERHALGTLAERTYTAALADLDGDKDLDLVVGNDRPDAKRVYLNDGKGQFTVGGTFGNPEWSTRNVTVADLDGDARPDIIVANRGGPDRLCENVICDNDGQGRFPSCRPLSRDSATTIAAADMDGDGSIDLIVPHQDPGQSYLFLNDGHGQFAAKQAIGPADAATRAVATGDLNGDGRLDLVMGDELRGGAHVYFNEGEGQFSAPVSLDVDQHSVYSIAVADLNRDGRLDVVLGNDSTPSLVLINEGDGRRYTATPLAAVDGAVYGLAVGDLTGDGCADIVAARSNARSILYINACAGR